MSLEAPIQIDLSGENAQQSIEEKLGIAHIGPLTSEQQQERALLTEYFETQRAGTIYLTQGELWKLRETLAIENSVLNNPRWTTDSAYTPWERLQNFMTEQILEGLSSSDIIDGVEWENLFSVELLDSLDRHSHTLLFGNSWVFSWLENISNTAKDHVSVSLTLSLMESLRANPTQLQNMIEALPETDIAEHINQVLGERFSELSGAIENNPDIEEILWNGEQNAIFMNTETGREFFSWVLDGSITRSNMISEITRHGSRDEISPSIWNIEDIRNLLTLSREEFTDIIASGRGDVEAWESPPAWTDAPGPELPPEVEDRFARLRESKPLWEFLAAILEFLEWLSATFWLESVAQWNTERTEAWPGEWTPPPEVTPPNRVMTTLTSITPVQLWNSINRERLLRSLADSATQTQINTLLARLIPNSNAEKTAQYLFGSETNVFSRFRAKLEEAWFPILTTQSGEHTDIAQFQAVLEEYRLYRESDGVQWRTEGRTTWEDYIRQRTGSWTNAR